MLQRVTCNSFNGGLISESAEHRHDLKIYSSAARRLENFLTTPPGSLIKVPGFENIDDVDGAIKLVPFAFSTTQQYVFVLSDLALDVYTPDGTHRATVTTTWPASAIPTLRWTQSLDTAIFTHPDYPARKLVRGGSHTAWTLSDITWDYPAFTNQYRSESTITLTASATTLGGSITLTASAALFDSTWVGRFVRLHGAGTGYCEITAYTNSTTVTATVRYAALLNTSAQVAWEEAAWGAVRGYPVCATFHQSRLIIGGAKSLPATLWSSTTGKPFNLIDASGTTSSPPPVLDSDGFEFTLSSDTVNAIVDLYSVRGVLIVNTTSAEWIEKSLPITPSSVAFTLQTRHGMSSSGIRSVGIDADLLFVDRTGTQLRALGYSLAADAYIAANLTKTAPGVVNAPVAAVYQRALGSTQGNYLWIVNADGSIASLCLDESEGVRGWSRLTMPAGALVKSLTVVEDRAWALIQWNATTWLARLGTDTYVQLYQSDDDVTPKTTWTGFTDYAGETVTVLGDGYVFEDVEVNGSGEFTLSSAVEEVVVGIGAVAALYESLPLEAVERGQLVRGRRTRKIAADISYRNAADLWADGRRIEFRRFGDDLLDQPATTQDGNSRVLLSGIGAEPTLTLESRLPLPCEIIGYTVELKF